MFEFAVFYAKISHISELMKSGKSQQALVCLDTMVKQGAFAVEEYWAVLSLYGTCFYDLNDLEKMMEYQWASIQSTQGQPLRIQQENYSDYLMVQHYLAGISDEEWRQKCFSYNRLYRDTVQFTHSWSKHCHKKLRIGYLTAAMAENIGSYFAIQLFSAYDHSRYEVYCYGVREKDDALTDQIRNYVKKVTIFPKGVLMHDAAQAIYQDEIDILFDMDVHNGGGRTLMIAGYKPAPVQIGGIGYMSTSGLQAMDYFLGDIYCDPPGLNEADFSEELLRLPNSHLCYTPTERVLRCQRSYQRHGGIRFASFNKFFKITDEMLLAWWEILQRVPESHLLLKNAVHHYNALSVMHKRLLSAGFREDQFTLEDASVDYLERYADVDILLDTYPYTGGGTTCEALYRGVPVVSRYGRRHGERFGYSLLENTGLGELACPDIKTYIQTAVALAQDENLLRALHQHIPEMMQHSPVMDGPEYVQGIERLYEEIWSKWIDRQKEKEGK